jgi:TolB-like protein
VSRGDLTVKVLETKDVTQPSPEAVRAACARITASKIFENSERMIRFLDFVVGKTLAGKAGDLKEYLLGVEVFDRDQSFDPKTDTIVRVEARRLRRKLKEYYDGVGAREKMRIDMPTPGYAAVFSVTEAPAAGLLAAGQRQGWPTIAIAAGCLGIAIGGAAWWKLRSPARPAGTDSIAVLPFLDMSSGKDQAYFCDGFTEELISALSSIEGLRVVARTSAFAFKDKAQDIREIGNKLGVGTVLEGSVRRSGDTLRITAQLIRTSDGSHVWSRSYDRKMEDVLTVQEEISQRIADTFRHPFEHAAAGTANPEAYDLYMLGRAAWNRQGPEDLQQAIGHFEKAISLDPKFALAYSGLSEAYSYLIDLDYAPTAEILPKARSAADRALGLNVDLAEAHTSRAIVAHELEWDQSRAKKEFLKAIQLKPGYAYGIHWHGHFLENQGKLAEGQQQLRRALEIDPLSRMYNIDLAMNQYYQHQFDEALATANRVQEIQADYIYLEALRGLIYQAQRDWPKAIASLRKMKDAAGPIPIVVALLGQTEALAGDSVGARRELAELERASKTGYVPDHAFSMIYYALGDKERGLSFLKKSFDARTGFLVWAKASPMFAQIAADPRAKELLDRAGGPPPVD